MIKRLKDSIYFSVAGYFRVFAAIRLARWHPRVVVVTGSNGKTTTLHLIATQLGNAARYSYGANSSFGIPFDILGLARATYSPIEWIGLFAKAPFKAFARPYPEKIYVVEADCDRPGEGTFLAKLLHPEVVVWLSSARTHSRYFDSLVRAGAFPDVDRAIVHEFGNFLEHARHTIINADNPLIAAQQTRAKGKVLALQDDTLHATYSLDKSGTTFTINDIAYRVPFLLPEEAQYSIAAAVALAKHFDIQPTNNLREFVMPPGRSSLLRGQKNTTIIDSTYNVNVASLAAILAMTESMQPYPKPLWLVIGDLTEQGAEEQEEHERVADLLHKSRAEKIILVGPRLALYALPRLQPTSHIVVSFANPKDALEYLSNNLHGGETILFKGARFLEGIVEHLLADPADAKNLCRREAVWQQRRAQWGL